MYANTGLILARIVMLMPMFIKTLFLALLFVSGSAFAEWRFITVNSNNDSVYIDPNTIRKDGNMRTYWWKAEYKKRGKAGEMSSRAKYEVDCKKEVNRLLAFASFAEPNLRGEIITSGDYPNDSFMAIAPETIDNTLMQIVCK
jgi:hypothetical protein